MQGMMLPFLSNGLKMTVSFLKIELNKPVPKDIDKPELPGREVTCRVL